MTGHRITRIQAGRDPLATAHQTATARLAAPTAAPITTTAVSAVPPARYPRPVGDRHRETVIDRYQLGNPMKQIARELGIGYNTVRNILLEAHIPLRRPSGPGRRRRQLDATTAALRGHRSGEGRRPSAGPPPPHPAKPLQPHLTVPPAGWLAWRVHAHPPVGAPAAPTPANGR